MIQMQTMVNVADNTGAKTARCIKVLGSNGEELGRAELQRELRDQRFMKIISLASEVV